MGQFAVTFRDDNPHAEQRAGVYEKALVVAGLVDEIIHTAEGRFHLKDTLDRESTSLVLRVAHAGGELDKGGRRSHYRAALRSATSVAAVLDILNRREAIAAEIFEPARMAVAALVEQLAHLAAR